VSRNRICYSGLLLVPAAVGLAPAAAQSPALHIWASPALYGLEGSACGRAADRTADDDTAMIAPSLCDAVKRLQPAIAARFTQLVALRMPGAEDRFGAHLPSDATARARLAGSAVASLRLSRATIWRVPKGGSVETHMPITLTLDISNIATGEVLATQSISDDAAATYAGGEVDGQAAANLPDHIDAVLIRLVDQAAAAWKPYPINATVLAEANGRWIIDKGRSAGLRTGDMIGEDGEVLHAGPDYAVVKPVLASYRTGQQLARTATQPVDMLARPSLLSVVATIPPGYPRIYLTQIFEDALGKAGHFAPVPVNPSMMDLRTRAMGDAGATSDESRSLPDYMARISVDALAPSAMPSNVPGVTIEQHEAHVFVELVDPSGRVLASFHAADQIVDQIAGGIRFSADQRRDTVVRNALTKVAQALSAWRPSPAMLPVSQNGEGFSITDPGGALSLGQQVVVLRRIGKVGPVADVRLPVGRLRVDQALAGQTLAASDIGMEPLRFKAGDMVIIDAAGQALGTRRAVDQCRDASGTPSVDWRGDAQPSVWRIGAGPLFTGSFAAPTFIADLPMELAPFAPSFKGWEMLAAARPRRSDYCFTPVLSLSATAQGQRPLVIGYTLRNGTTKLGGGAMQVQMTPTTMTPDSAAEMRAARLEQDFAAVALPLASKAAAALKPPVDAQFTTNEEK